MTTDQYRATVAPATAWKIKTGNRKLSGEFLDWLANKKKRFLALMERLFPGISERPLTQDELDIFCDWICETEGVKYRDD